MRGEPLRQDLVAAGGRHEPVDEPKDERGQGYVVVPAALEESLGRIEVHEPRAQASVRCPVEPQEWVLPVLPEAPRLVQFPSTAFCSP